MKIFIDINSLRVEAAIYKNRNPDFFYHVEKTRFIRNVDYDGTSFSTDASLIHIIPDINKSPDIAEEARRIAQILRSTKSKAKIFIVKG